MRLAEWGAKREFDHVGTRLARAEASDKVRGAAVYTSDVLLPNMAHGCFVRSSEPHADIAAIRTEEAMRMPGVLAVLTGDTLAEHGMGDLSWFGEEVPLFATRARYVGDEIALVVAETRRQALAAVDTVHVVSSPLPHVVDPIEALTDGSPPVHDGGNLAEDEQVDGRGDVDAALATCDTVVRATYRTPTALHQALETHGAVAAWDSDGLTVHCSTQGINDVREMLAARLGLDHTRVRVLADHVGGGFGAKQVPWKPTVAAAAAARVVGRPVKVMNERRGESLAAGKRNATVQHVTIGVDTDGTIRAIEADLIADNGAYSVAGEASNVPGLYLHLYRCENVRTRYRRAYTNTGPAVAFRAPGYLEASFALESTIDLAAAEIGIDPLELRRRNIADRDQQQDLPWSSPDALPTALDLLEDSVTQLPADRDGVVHGRGWAVCEWMAATAMPPGVAWAELNADGTLHIGTSAQDIGTGTRTMLAMVAAEEFGVDPERIRVSLGDTEGGPPAPTSAGSTTVPTMAPAVRAAVAELRRRVLAEAAHHLEAAADGLAIDGGAVVDEHNGGTVDLAELVEAIDPHGFRAFGERVEQNDEVSPRAHAAAVADVAVDTRTGQVRVLRLAVAPDCGRIIDRTLVDSQVIGGVTQGIGFALSEQQPFDPMLGIAPDAGLETYLVPTAGDTCEIVHAEVDMPDLAANPLGVKGIGELPLIPVPAAIANAVADATGHRFDELPLDRRRMLTALSRDAEGTIS